MSWSVLYDLDDNDVHVIPVGDLIGHDLTGDCVCRPRFDLVKCALGQDGWVVVHQSLDGREAGEGAA